MNLVIDIGNTRTKAALFHNKECLSLKVYNSLHDLLNDTPFFEKAQQAIIASVVDGLEHQFELLNSLIPTIIFTSDTPIPIQNLYLSSATLGSDRLCASIAGYALYPHSNVLTIDAGTCLKYNFVNEDNQYLGGGISPGLTMRFKALAHFTSKLPLVEIDVNECTLIGNNTQSSILSGVINGAVSEIDGIISNYKSLYPQIFVLLTGGDSEFLAKQLKNSIFAHQNLVLKGLNYILNYNLELQKS